MRTIPFTSPKVEEPYTEKAPKEEPAAEAKPETTPAPATPKQEPEKPFLQKYGWLIVVALLIAAAWLFNKYKLVPKISIPTV